MGCVRPSFPGLDCWSDCYSESWAWQLCWSSFLVLAAVVFSVAVVATLRYEGGSQSVA